MTLAAFVSDSDEVIKALPQIDSCSLGVLKRRPPPQPFGQRVLNQSTDKPELMLPMQRCMCACDDDGDVHTYIHTHMHAFVLCMYACM